MFDIQLIIIFIISITFFVLTLLRPKIALLAFIGLIPLMHKEVFSIYKWDYLPIRFALIGLFAGIVVPFIVRQIKLKNHLNRRSILNFIRSIFWQDRVMFLLLLLLITKVISLLFAGNLFENFQYIIFFGIAMMLYSIIHYGYIKHGSAFFYKYINVYLIIGFVAVLFAYLQFFLYLQFNTKIGAIWPVANNLPRLGSAFWDVNHFGGYLVTLIPLYFVYTFIAKKPSLKLFSFIALGSSSAMLFLTQSRSSWLGLFVALIFGLALFAFKRYLKVIGLFAVGVAVMSVLFFTYLDFKDLSIREKVRNYMHYRLDSTDSHMMLLEGAVQVYMNNLLLGTGSGNFDQAFRKTSTSTKYFEKEPNIKKTEIPPHSIWGEILSENGYIGFAVYIFMMFFVLAGLFKLAIQSKETQVIMTASGLFISLLGILITGIFYSYNLEFYWFIFSIAALYCSIQLGNEFQYTKILETLMRYRFMPYLTIVVFAAFFIFIKLAGVTLLEWDEAIYAKVAKNMYETGDWLNLRWPKTDNLWLEKPPLYMWLSTVVFNLIGPDEFAARFWAAILGIAGIVVTFILGKKLFNRFTGFVSAFILLSTVHYLYYARNSILDVPVTFFIVLAVTFFVYGLEAKKFKNMLYIGAGASIGLGVMTKAIVGLIPLVIIFLYLIALSIINKRITGFKAFFVITISMLAVAMPWHIYSYYSHGYRFIEVYLLEHIFDRSTEGLGHVQPLFWYQEVLRTSLRIWILPFICGLFLLPFMEHKKRHLLLVYVAVFFIFTFFSLPADKLLWYLVPIYPFTAIVAARFLDLGIEALKYLLKTQYLHKIRDVKILFIVLLVLLTPFYITLTRDRIFFEDENRDIVELIKVHNQIYPANRFTNFYLRYSRVPYTVALYYSDHEPKYVSTEDMLNLMDDAGPNDFYTFLITQTRYYQLRDLMKTEVDIPSDLRVKASSGEYVIARTFSRVDLLQEKLTEINADISVLYKQKALGQFTDFDQKKLVDLEKEYADIVSQIDGYAN